VRAFISIDSDDEIWDLPTNYSVPQSIPINGPTGTNVAYDWYGIIVGTEFLTNSMSAAGVTSSDAYWTGTRYQGPIPLHATGFDCAGWTSSDSSALGNVGLSAYGILPLYFIPGGSDRACDATGVDLLCIAF
jgi:hypothetical protein